MTKPISNTAGIVSLCFMLFLSFSIHAQVNTSVSVVKTSQNAGIGNGYINRDFSIVDGRLKTTSITNFRTDGAPTVFTPGSKSEEFVIATIKKTTPVTFNSFVKTGWTVEVNSVTSSENAPASAIIDGNVSTYWHSNYGSGTGTTSLPFYFIIDMKSAKTINSFRFTPRPTGINGIPKTYKFYVSDTKEALATATPCSEGSITFDGNKPTIVGLTAPQAGRFVKFEILSTQNDGNFGSCGEFDLSADTYIAPKTTFSTSDLTLTEATTGEIENGKSLRFNFAPFKFNDIDWTVSMHVEMKDGDHFMRKYLEITVPEAQREMARLDYIDCEYLQTNAADAKWTHPEMGSGVGGMSGYWISLGQPVYIQGMFFGSEFPQTETSIPTDGIGHIRYFSGKSMALLSSQNRLTDGIFLTWKTVTGAARSTELSVIQSDFFDYINSISTPSKYRLQYNSWYDFMMDINENNIQSSFYEMEKGFSQHGVRPMDSYVVDDGWNAYGPFQGENTTGFWQFNSKFPNGLTNAAELSHRFSSNFGLWLGPRGGYNYNYDFGKFLEAQGNGMYNPASGDVTTNHKKYLEKLQEFFLDNQDKYRINYWKWDGFSTQANPLVSDQFITGGEQGMYYMTEHWERWIEIMKVVRAKSESQGLENMWLNLTCYVNPSPWLLQWANSVWIQNSNDIGRHDTGRARQLDQLLSYRDGRYFDFNQTRKFQFPFANIYNHDPIYGKTGTNLANQMIDDEFRAYLMMMATRGSAFWELYYSYTMLDEGQKWMINGDVLNWIESNFNTLRNSKIIGTNPENSGVYGYSCWDGYDGIISVRNSSTTTKSYTLTLDRTIGVKEGAANLHRTTALNFLSTTADNNIATYNYGQQITVSLQPGEIRIWQFSPNADTTPVRIETVKCSANNTVTMKFSERVKISNTTFKINGNVASSAILLADFRTVKLTFAPVLSAYEQASLTVENIEDYSANKSNGFTDFVFYPQGVILTAENTAGFTGSSHSIGGVSDFNISFNLTTTEKNTTIFKQEDEVLVSIDADGKLVFSVKGLSLTSNAVVADGTSRFVSLCREQNGMLKIYLSGNVDKSIYDKTRLNESLTNAPITLGSNFSNLMVHNYALPYNVVYEIVNPPVRPKYSTENQKYWYRIQDNNTGNSNKMFTGADGSYTNRLKYRRTWGGDNAELFKFVQNSPDNQEECYMYSKLDETIRISVNPATANLIQVFNNPANDTWKIFPSKDPHAFCIQAVKVTASNNVMNAFQNSASGGIIGFWNDDGAGDKGSQWVFEERMIETGFEDLSTVKGFYAKNRKIHSINPETQFSVYTIGGMLVKHDVELMPGLYIVRIKGSERAAKVLVK